jgi:hypothetical protein
MVKEALQEYIRIADDVNNVVYAHACFRAGTIYTSPGPYTDVKKGVRYLRKATKKGVKAAETVLRAVHNNTKEGKFMGPLTSADAGEFAVTGHEDFMQTLRRTVLLNNNQPESVCQDDQASASGTHGGGIADLISRELARFCMLPEVSTAGVYEYTGPEQLYDGEEEIMSEYVQRNPGSIAGHTTLRAVKHFLQFAEKWGDDRQTALMHLYWAYMFDEKSVKLLSHKDETTGKSRPYGVFADVHELAKTMCADIHHPMRFFALLIVAILEMMTQPEPDKVNGYITQAITAATSSDASPSFKAAVPRLHEFRAFFKAKLGDAAGALKSYQDSLKTMQDDPSVSLFPYAIPELRLELVRKQHMLNIDASAGRALLQFPARRQDAIPKLNKFLESAQHDTHWYYYTHFDLAEAYLLSESNHCGGDELTQRLKLAATAEDILARAERHKRSHIPVRKPPSEAECPKMSQITIMLNCIKHLTADKRKTGPSSNPNGVHRAGPGAAGSTDAADKNVSKCWGCDNQAGLVCSRCRVARFCSAECQRRVWKQHKVDCNKLCGAQEKA